MLNFCSYASSSSGNMYSIDDSKTKLILEPGLPISKIKRRLGFKLSEYSGALCTHLHKDHSQGAKGMVESCIDLWTSKETIEAVGLSDHHRVHEIKPMDTFTIGTWKIKAFDTIHDCEGCLGFYMVNSLNEGLLFATDTAYIKYRFNNLHTIAIGCNFDIDLLNSNIESGIVDRAAKSRIMHSHASLETIKDMLMANDLSKVKEIFLLHLSDRNSSAADFKRQIQEITGVEVHVA